MLVDEAIIHSFKQQLVIVLLFCEIEHMTLFEATKEAIWIRRFLNELNFKNNQLVLIFADNKSAIDLIINSLYHKRTKHIEMRWHWIRKMMNRKKITLRYLFINEVITNELTKSLFFSVFEKFKRILNLSHWLIDWNMIIILIENYHYDQVRMLNKEMWDHHCKIAYRIARTEIEVNFEQN
jgi:hypothetical protein